MFIKFIFKYFIKIYILFRVMMKMIKMIQKEKENLFQMKDKNKL